MKSNRFGSHPARGTRIRRALPGLALAALALDPTAVQAQRDGPRIWFSAWAGRFTQVGGFSEGDLDAFYRFEDATAFGGGVHVPVNPGLVLGVDVLYARPEYDRVVRADATLEGSGDAKIGAAMASFRLAGGGGIVGLYLTGGAGVFAWDLDDPELDEGWDLDPALQIAAGLEYSVRPRTRLFGEYGQWWVYHQKDAAVTSNRPVHNLLRFGLRQGL